ncbi:hypothetical protein A0H81_00220, partial [Grifola frondosa]
MVRKPKTIPGPSRLSQILVQLTKEPRPRLAGLKSLHLTLAARNDHFGARHFVKEDLPRIRYANPEIEIQVNKTPKSLSDRWKPEMIIEFSEVDILVAAHLLYAWLACIADNGTKRTLSMEQKWSSTIFTELMDMTAGTWWAQWKKERIEAGLPIVEEPKPEQKKVPHLPSGTAFLLDPSRPKTGAAAVLP